MASSTEPERRVKQLLEEEASIKVAYLFGSMARGSAGPMSDMDIGVLVAAGADRRETLGGLMDRLVLGLGTERIDLVDLEAAPAPLRYRVARDGRVLVCRDPVARERFEVDAVRRYLDFQPLRDRAFAVARAAILRAG